VHPEDSGGRPGKTEMWHIVRAEPGAAIAVGLKREIAREALREAAVSGEIEEFLNWVPVQPGDTIFVPARTIHAIGAGIALCEIQQQSDVTYRIYDFGRPRKLHLDRGIEVASLSTHPGKSVPSPLAEGEWRLAACPYFVTDLIELASPRRFSPAGRGSQILIVLEGSGKLGSNPFGPGQAWLVPPEADDFLIQPESKTRLLRTYVG
jgi:mannose-6-phosphate isomerase